MYDYWNEDYIEHHGIKGQKWGIRRYQYDDGSLTPEGRKRYLKGDGSLTRAGKKELSGSPKEAVDSFCKKYKINTSVKVGDILDKKVSNDDATTNAKNDGTKNIYKPIKNIPTGVNNIFGLMETGLNQKDGKRYAQLWNKFQNNPKVAYMDVWDLGLNVDGDDPYYGRQLAKDVEEFSALHNKAYHNVYG